MSPQTIRMSSIAILASLLTLLVPSTLAADAPDRQAQTILHMLDYVSVDYGGAVQSGKILNEGEFREQVEFAEQAVKFLSTLPEHPLRSALVKEGQLLSRSVQAIAPAEQVSASAQQLRRSIIDAYQIPISPVKTPKLEQASALYQKLCVSCHGAAGQGDGPDGMALDPKPSNFHDSERMAQRSIYGLYNTITLGVVGTGMTGYTELSDDERWSLAFLASNFRTSKELIEQGSQLWKMREEQDAPLNLVALTTLTENEFGIRYGDQTKSLFSYLRAEPQALESARPATFRFASEQLDLALTHYRDGDSSGAQRFAISAYLEGFEPMEASLNVLNSQLRLDIEREMMALRQLMNGNTSTEVVALKVDHAKAMLKQADELLQEGKLTAAGAFAGAFLILLREGLEAILVLTAVIAFVVKSGQRQALVYIHTGWGVALFLGIFTWVAATWLVDVSGANREITEGVTALIASGMLIYVGFWLHDKAHAQAWQKFLKEKVGAALEQKTLWALALVSFFAVYREIFETVIFYQALWAQSGEGTRSALWGGMLSAALILAATGWGLFRFGLRLPLGPFFTSTSILLAILAVIFAGQGIAALQKAGIVDASAVDFISLPMLGVFPTTQTLLAQVAVIAILLLCYHLPSRRQKIGPA